MLKYYQYFTDEPHPTAGPDYHMKCIIQTPPKQMIKRKYIATRADKKYYYDGITHLYIKEGYDKPNTFKNLKALKVLTFMERDERISQSEYHYLSLHKNLKKILIPNHSGFYCQDIYPLNKIKYLHISMANNWEPYGFMRMKNVRIFKLTDGMNGLHKIFSGFSDIEKLDLDYVEELNIIRFKKMISVSFHYNSISSKILSILAPRLYKISCGRVKDFSFLDHAKKIIKFKCIHTDFIRDSDIKSLNKLIVLKCMYSNEITENVLIFMPKLKVFQINKKSIW